jgi:hypothetical protein
MPTPNPDLLKITELLREFALTKRFQDSMTKFLELGISGWEKWWQMELAVYLAGSPKVAEWDMEHPFDVDKRRGTAQTRMALDVGFRMSRHASDSWYFVELKQDNDYQKLLQRMAKDVEKVFSARTRSFDGLKVRYIACAGIFADQGDAHEEIIEYAETIMESIGAESGGVELEDIGKHHTLIVF